MRRVNAIFSLLIWVCLSHGQESKMLGNWKNNAIVKKDSSITIVDGVFSYSTGNKTTNSGSMYILLKNGWLKFDYAGAGRWSVQKDTLTELIDTFTITNGVFNSKPLEPSELAELEEKFTIGMGKGSRQKYLISKLNDVALTWKALDLNLTFTSYRQ